jgi:hypothetical protein
MRVAVFHSDKQRCNDLAAAIYAGVRRGGDECIRRDIYTATGDDVDLGIVQGVRRRELFASLKRWVYVDKGYVRNWDWRRIAVNACEPVQAGTLGTPSDRRLAVGWCPKPWRRRGGHVLLCSSNEDEHTWRGLLPPEKFAEFVVRTLRKYTDREIVYRTKPNRQPVRALSGVVMSDSRRPLAEMLVGAHAVVTVSGGASICAILEGVPAIVLGDGPTMSISSQCIAEIEKPRLASDTEREAVLNDLAYHQWRVEEFMSGEAWRWIKERPG